MIRITWLTIRFYKQHFIKHFNTISFRQESPNKTATLTRVLALPIDLFGINDGKDGPHYSSFFLGLMGINNKQNSM